MKINEDLQYKNKDKKTFDQVVFSTGKSKAINKRVSRGEFEDNLLEDNQNFLADRQVDRKPRPLGGELHLAKVRKGWRKLEVLESMNI